MPDVSYPGLEGAFTHKAARLAFENARLHSFPVWEEAALAVLEGRCDFGVFPYSNTLAGSVPKTAALLKKYRLKTVKTFSLPIRQHLLGIPGAALSQIQRIHSHSHAIAQCRPFLAAHPEWRITLSQSTAISADYVSRRADCAVAAIASLEAAYEYGLIVLQKDIHSGENETSFVVIAREEPVCQISY